MGVTLRQIQLPHRYTWDTGYRMLLLTTSSMMSLTQATCSLTPSKDNLVAARLEGNWTVNGPFSARLSPDGKTSTAPVGEVIVSFKNDSGVLDDMSADQCDLLESNELEIYSAGTLQFLHVELGVMTHTFFLTSIEGVPAVIYWQGESPVTNLVQVAPALFLSTTFSSWERRVLTSLSACWREWGPRQAFVGIRPLG